MKRDQEGLERWHRLIDYGVATQARTGELVTGDAYLVQQLPHGVLAAVVDGLGHGQAAANAATIAITTLTEYAHEDIVALVHRCHTALQGTRGVVLSLALLNALADSMTWIGVGNVEGVLLSMDVNHRHRQAFMMLRGGVVGYQLPPLRATVVPIRHGDTLILATDGIRSGFATRVNLSQTPQHMAADILARYDKGTDDAMVLVVRWHGWQTANTGLLENA
jgi:negative regulator of sigma-B (phosphoserine phosphatase)